MTTTTPRLEHLDPNLLTTVKNVRAELAVDKDFVSSIKKHGVEQPITAYADPDNAGKYCIHFGHRRAAAAVKAGLDLVPVIIIAEPTDRQRLAEQFTENVHRAALTQADEARVYQQLALDGMPAIDIAAFTATKMARVGSALKIAEHPAAIAVLQEHNIDLAQAALITEFADDKDAVKKLTEYASSDPGRLEHEAQRIRDARAREDEKAALIAAGIASGAQLANKPLNYQGGNKYKLLSMLADKKTGDLITPESHVDCPGHAFYVGVATYSEGAESYDNEIATRWICTDPTANGHRHKNRIPAPGLTDDERAARKQAREDKADWMSASAVREAWIRETLLAGPITGSSATNWLTGAHHTSELFQPSMGGARSVAGRWLMAGGSSKYSYDSLTNYLHANPTKGLTAALAVALAGMEEVIAAPKGDTKGWDDNRGKIGPYLERLAALGYGLSSIEQRVVDADRQRNTKKGDAAA